MAFVVFVLGFLALAVVAPLVVIGHYVTRWRAERGLSAEDEQRLAELMDTAERLRARVVNLEKVLDDEVPGWRVDT